MSLLGTDASLLQDITLVILWISGGLNLLGVLLGKLHRRREHFYVMLGTAVTVLAFLTFYLLRVLQEGPTEFRGPDEVKAGQYLPLISIHAVTAISTVALLTLVVLLALGDLAVVDGKRVLQLAPKEKYHHRFWVPFVILWLSTIVTGTLVYGYLFWWYT